MVTLLLALASAAPVQCEPIAAAQILDEAKIDEAGAPKTHSWLIPGLALASPRTEGELRTVLNELCAPGGELSVTPTAHWDTASWSAHTLRLTRSETRDCILFERSILLTVGVQPGAAARYALQATLPLSQTPVGDCEAEPRWRQESVIAGAEGPVRVVLGTLREGDRITQSEVLIRRATPEGWHEQVLAEPAPERLLGGFAGPMWQLTEHDGEWIAVASHDRSGTPEGCHAIPGQRAWTWSGVDWTAHDSDDARSLLAQAGLWRMAGEPGWLMILAQDTESDRDLLEARARRLRRRNPSELLILQSAEFPELNAGYLVVAPPPFSDRTAAEAERANWGRRSASYVKRAWPAPDACREDGSR